MATESFSKSIKIDSQVGLKVLSEIMSSKTKTIDVYDIQSELDRGKKSINKLFLSTILSK